MNTKQLREKNIDLRRYVIQGDSYVTNFKFGLLRAYQ